MLNEVGDVAACPAEGSRALRRSKAITAWRTMFSADRSVMLGGVLPCWVR
jgi:hypothetical protein